jgi:hypothetical protein
MNTTELTNKYYELVWLARRTPEDFENPLIKNLIDDTCSKFPEESVELLEGENSQWTHGFNSGMLACLRLLSCARIYPHNLDEFPNLDS